MGLLHCLNQTDGYMNLPPLIFYSSTAVLYCSVVTICLSSGDQTDPSLQYVMKGGREEVILEYWPPTSPLLCLCVSSWLTTEWNSASGGWLSSKPSSSHPRALCLITTSILRARSLNPGPRWCPSLRWMQICRFRYDKLFQEIWQISSNNNFSLALIIILQHWKKSQKSNLCELNVLKGVLLKVKVTSKHTDKMVSDI